MNKISKFGIITLALLALCVSVQAQVFRLISLPPALVLTGAASWGTTATTNIGLGFAGTSVSSNITTTASVSAGVVTLTTATNLVTNSATLYADFNAIGAPWVTLQSEYNATATTTSNQVLTVARSVTGVKYDTQNNINVTNATSGITTNVGIWQIDMRGYPYGRIVTVTFQSTNLLTTLTNAAIYVSTSEIKQRGGP